MSVEQGCSFHFQHWSRLHTRHCSDWSAGNLRPVHTTLQHKSKTSTNGRSSKSTVLPLHDRWKLEKFKLSTAQSIGCSFDGAASISGRCNGLQAQLKKNNTDMKYVCCYGHSLNLVMTESTESCKVTKDFLELLQSTANFISESHKWMQVWKMINNESASGQQLLHRHKKFCATRWWRIDRALDSVFDDISIALEEEQVHIIADMLACYKQYSRLHFRSNVQRWMSAGQFV